MYAFRYIVFSVSTTKMCVSELKAKLFTIGFAFIVCIG